MDPAEAAARSRSRSRHGRHGKKKKKSSKPDSGRSHHADQAAAAAAAAAPSGYAGYPPGYSAQEYVRYPGYHPGYGGPGVHGAVMGMPPMMSGMADDGVSVQVSEKFLMRNDYCQTYVDSGMRPQNYIRDLDYANRYSEYPKIERLIKLKDDILARRATPAMSLKCDLKSYDLSRLGTKFDVVLVDPPWEEYQSRVAGMYVPNEDLSYWSMDELRQLRVGDVADSQSFCFLWCGETHLEHGRELLKRWGFRRVEDICWVKTNRAVKVDQSGKVERPTLMYGDTSICQRTKEHCLVGVKGTLKRSVDTHFIHANCDVDLIMEEEKEFGSTEKPKELYETIEHFCLGRRRLELFGLDRNLRDGWLTLGNGLTTNNWNKAAYLSWFDGEGQWPQVKDYKGGRLLGSIAEIETLRPKSPVRPGRQRSRSPMRSLRDKDGGGGGSSSALGGGRRHQHRERSSGGGGSGGPGGGHHDDDFEKPLPEDLGEMAPPLPKDDDV